MRKNISLTLVEKGKLFTYFRNNKHLKMNDFVNWIKKNFNKTVDRSTISKMLKSGLEYDVKISNGIRNKKVKYPELEKEILEWVLKYECVTTISDSMIREQGKIIADKLDIKENGIKFSEGWLCSFKKRNCIKKHKLHGESGSVDQNIINTQLPALIDVIKEYDSNDVFNFDETGLFYRMEPDTTLASKVVEGRKKDKSRITIGLCTNATGNEKMDPLIIGKYSSPRCFKNINLINMGIIYKNNSKAWMTRLIFKEWILYFNNYIKNKDSSRRVLLLVDNASSHSHIENTLSNVKLHYLIPNTTSKLQPLDAGIIANFKIKYRSYFIKEMLRKITENHNNNNMSRPKIDLITAIRFIKRSWEEISSDTITNCWKHTEIIKIDIVNKSIQNFDDSEIKLMISSLNLENPMSFVDYIMLEDNITEEKLDENNAEANTETGKDDTVEESTIPSKTALNYCNQLVKYLEHQAENCTEMIKSLRNIDVFIENKKRKDFKQMSIMDFITK